SRSRHTRWPRDWSSDVCSSDLVLVVALCAALVTRRGREALRRGPPAAAPPAAPPPAAPRVEAVPELSVAPPLIAVALASILFGVAFGHFLIYFGCGLLALSLGRLALELRAARASSRRYAAAVSAQPVEAREAPAPGRPPREGGT